MRTPPLVRQALVPLLLASPAAAIDPPLAVSPGHATEVARIESRCPTFTWSAVEGASSYELVVYRLGERNEEMERLLARRFAGAVDGWTPELGSCLARGGRYAWSVRAVDGQGGSEWSGPSLFEVAAGPGALELDEALDVLRRYLGALAPERRTRPVRPGAPSSPSGGAMPLGSAPEAASPGPAPRAHEGSGGSIVVDGALAETKADPPCWPSAGDPDAEDRFIDCGNGTVHDTVTNLLWLKKANCLYREILGVVLDDGLRNWWEANQFASGLDSGRCGLSDHSQPGDWRLATKAEWESILDPNCPGPIKLAGRAGGCYPDAPWAEDLQELNYWTSTSDGPLPRDAWHSSNFLGLVGLFFKTTEYYVWPVRSTQ